METYFDFRVLVRLYQGGVRLTIDEQIRDSHFFTGFVGSSSSSSGSSSTTSSFASEGFLLLVLFVEAGLEDRNNEYNHRCIMQSY